MLWSVRIGKFRGLKEKQLLTGKFVKRLQEQGYKGVTPC